MSDDHPRQLLLNTIMSITIKIVTNFEQLYVKSKD